MEEGGDTVITRIEIEGFRSFRDCAVDLSPFTVLVGQNSSGKTNLLEAIDLAGQLAGAAESVSWSGRGTDSFVWSDEVRPGGDRRGRVIDLFHRYADGTVADRIRIAVDFLRSDATRGMSHLRMVLEIVHQGGTTPPQVRGELFSLADVPARWRLTGDQSAEIRRNAPIAGAIDLIAWHAPRSHWYRLVPDPDAARQDPDLHDDERMARDAHNLSAVLGRLLAAPHRARQKALQLQADAVAVLPGLTELRSTADPDRGTWELDLAYRDAAPTPARLASDGTLHVLSVLAAAHDGTGGPVRSDCRTLMIEDVENGLHPGQVKELVRRLRRTTGSAALQQIIVTTHSPVVLAALYPEHPDDVLFVDTVTRVGGGEAGSRHSRVRPLAESGERGTYVPAREARQYLETAQAGTR
ncbi:AAA family ATPase [Streptomyces sp. NPDC051569]|uniref:AAA family ATPase n=1 Tax=Streptomyces sp. NPDC051569 TaxID=3365661 RepID=UPI003790BBEF